MAKPNLKDLPEELVSNISLRLWSDDVQALRLTCKALEQKTLHEWATEYFSEKAFIISTESLRVLLNIANSGKLRSSLRRMHILTAYFSDSAYACERHCPHGHCCGWRPTIRQDEAWKFLVADQKALKTSGRDREMLTEALRKLPALRDIELVDSTSAVSVSVDIRMFRKVTRLCGRNFQLASSSSTKPESEYYKVLSHTWAMLTSAIANSGIITLKRLGTNLGKGNTSLCVPLDFRFTDGKLAGLKAAFQSLEDFYVQINTRPASNVGASGRATINKQTPPRLLKFAGAFPALQTLSLEMDGSLTDKVMFATLVQHMDLSKLKKLQLNSLFTDRQTLTVLFERLESIQELFMNFVNLTRGSWIPLMKELQKMDGHLEHLHMMYLLESGKKAYFLSQPDEDEMAQEDMMFDDMLMGGPEDDFDEGDDESDEDLPPLETMDGEIVDGGAGPPSTAPLAPTVEDDDEPPQVSSPGGVTLPSAASDPMLVDPSPSQANIKTSDVHTPAEAPPEQHASDDHKAPGNEQYPERGYYVCLHGKQRIKEQLTTFIREYNVGEDVDAHGPGPMGMGGIMGGAMTIPMPAGGGPPNANNILNGLAGYLGLPPMPGGPGGGAGGAGGPAAANQGGGGGHANINNNQAGGTHHAASTSAATTQGSSDIQATGGAAAATVGPAQSSALPPGSAIPAVSMQGVMGMMEDEWDTEAESSEFESE